MNRMFLLALLPLVLLSAAVVARADEVSVAVAANFTGPMEIIAPAFEHASGHTLRVSYGTVGKFHAQVKNGAPFDVLVSADATTPLRLEQDGLALPSSRFTYAIGKLVLWSSRPGLVDDKGEVLRRADFKHLAIANPKMAVYGAAAVETMKRLALDAVLEPRLVYGENITQTYQFAASGNAELAFVALSQIYKNGRYAAGSHWLVPSALYPTIRQDAVLLLHGKDNAGAAAFLAYLRGDAARQVIRAHGYEF